MKEKYVNLETNESNKLYCFENHMIVVKFMTHVSYYILQ